MIKKKMAEKLRKEFITKQKKMMDSKFEAASKVDPKVKERKNEKKHKIIEHDMVLQKELEKQIEETKKERKVESEEADEVDKAMKDGAVGPVIEKSAVMIEHVFDFYSMTEYDEPPLEKTMNLRRFVRFAF